MIKRLAKLLGYMTEAEAKRLGFTHHGLYYGIPFWVADPYGKFIAGPKWAALEPVVTLFHHIEAICHWIRGSRPSFAFKIQEIDHD